MELSQEILVSNFSKYKKRLVAYIGEQEAASIIEELGGEEVIMNATYANTENTGLAYNGSFTETVIALTVYAIEINNLLPQEKQASKESIAKVALLSQIGKVLLYKPQDNDWRKKNLGENYKYADLDGAIRVGERSILIAMNSGVKFTELEFEAMRIMDKQNENTDNYSKYFSGSLSTVIKQANEIIELIHRKK
jgi:hypothetical protein